MLQHMLEMMFSGGGSFTLNISSNTANPNIFNLASAAGWNKYSALVVNITAPLVNTLDIPASWSFPGGLTINISSGTRVGGVRNGGTALRVRQPVKISNLGTISGGGGPGGQGQLAYFDYNGTRGWGYGGNGGYGEGFFDGSSTTISSAISGGYGTTETYSGAVFGGEVRPSATGGNGGNGGSWGQAGSPGGFGSYSGSGTGGYGDWYQGSPPGYAVDGNSFVTWLNTGSRMGLIG